MNEHASEPWACDENGYIRSGKFLKLYNGAAPIVIKVPWDDDDERFDDVPLAIDNAKRIVDCVNALAGIPNPSAIPDVIAALRWCHANLDALRLPDAAYNVFFHQKMAQAAEALAKLEDTENDS